MNIIVCVEDRNGMIFNKRRVSQDVAVREDIYKFLGDKSLILNNYSYKMFEKDDKRMDIKVDENLPVKDNENYQFIENIDLLPFENQIDKLVIYYWNRRYPSSLKFNIDISNGKWRQISEIEFEGNSHDKITRKIFEKCN